MTALISVIVTILNEAKHLPDLLDSLSAQEPPFEVLVVDAGSTDGSIDIVRRFASRDERFRLLQVPGRRGTSRNVGVGQATGEYVAFIDGDCIANAHWLHRIREAAAPGRVVAGRTRLFGYWAFEGLQRVELEHKGYDVTYPSTNLAYHREDFLRLGGFDERFITAEDIDLNFRAVEVGLTIHYRPDAIVYHRARDSITGFLRQAFWNGYGRKQLTLKHGELWSEYSFRRLIGTQLHLWGVLRMYSAILGYLRCKIHERPAAWRARKASARHREVHA